VQPSALPQAQAQFDAAARSLGLGEAAADFLRIPQRELHIRFGARLDDGRMQIFSGFSILHSDARGPAKGGLRFHPQENADRVRALAMGRSWQAAAMDLPLGGCAGGVVCDPHGYSERELEGICRAWVRQVHSSLGARRLVLGPELMAGERELQWALDEHERLLGAHAPGAFAGKSLALGGSRGHAEATGYGLVYLIREALREQGLRLDAARASVQGFGTVARHAIALFTQLGGTVSCVASWDQAAGCARAFTKAGGIQLAELTPIADRYGGIDPAAAAARGYAVLPGEDWLAQEVEILIPAALEGQIGPAAVARLHPALRLVAEGANGALEAGAAEALRARGVVELPELLAGAGGMLCSYFEQVQGETNYPWELDEVLGRLDLKLIEAYQGIQTLAARQELSLREAALLLAVGRVASAAHSRGWI
jgi:glutamate dehydrogenase (NAD(P)+)